MRSLPGAPDFERLEFSVRFDPAAVKCPEGHTEALLPFTVSDPVCLPWLWLLCKLHQYV